MIIVLAILAWYLTGVFFSLLHHKYAFKTVKVSDLPFVMFTSIAGPLMLVVMLGLFIVNFLERKFDKYKDKTLL